MMQFDTRQFCSYMTAEDIKKVLAGLAAQINKDFKKDDKVLLVGVLKGTIILMADLVRLIEADVSVDFLRTSSYGKSLSSPGTVTLLKDLSTDVRDKHVIIIEEIIDSGRALKFIYNRLKAANPLSLKIATLLDKKKKRLVDVPVDYVGKVIDDEFLIGYGLDLEEKCRNLPDIYALKYPN